MDPLMVFTLISSRLKLLDQFRELAFVSEGKRRRRPQVGRNRPAQPWRSGRVST